MIGSLGRAARTPGDDVEAGAVGKLEVGHDQVRLLCLHQVQSLFHGAGALDAIIFALEQQRDDLRQAGIVVDEQDALAHIGKTISKRAPPRGSFEARMLPRISCTSS